MEKSAVDHITTQETVSINDLESLIRGYIVGCRCEGKSAKTIDSYQMVLRNFLWLCRQKGYPLEPQRINASHIREFLWYLASETNRWGNKSTAARKPASKTTVHDYFRILRTYFGWLEREGLIKDNPFKYLKRPKTDKKIVQALTSSEIKRLLKACLAKTALDTRNRAIICILLDCGLRISELASLTIDDVSVNSGILLIRHGKGGKQRTVRMGSQAQKALWRYLSIYRKGDSNKLFLTRSGEPLDVVGIKMMVKRLGNKANIKVHPHKLRHTFAISFLRAGGDAFSLQYLLGHSTLQMTQRYLQSLNADDAINAHRKFSPLDNMKM
ncbi:MAG: tyrosine-type recombinase/integrase [Chloroflexi bacterium]|nr:tyrosine-type recombinase/integrase [Chloroflexota bacterium]